MEVTTIFLYTLQPHLLQPAAFTNNEMLFRMRRSGENVGPTMHESVEMFDSKAALSKSVGFTHNFVTPTVGADAEVSSNVASVDIKAGGENKAEPVEVSVETVLASLVDTVITAATVDSASVSAVPDTINEKPREPLVIPSEPTLLLCPTVWTEYVILIINVYMYALCVPKYTL